MLVMIDPYADRAERVYVVELVPQQGDGGVVHVDERELPGRFAFIRDALQAYPGARISSQVGKAFARMYARAAAREDFFRDRRRGHHIPVG